MTRSGPRLAALRRDFSADNVVVSVARAQNSDGRVRQRRRLTVAPVGHDGTVTVIIYEMLIHGLEKGPHKFKRIIFE
jgi:hypothetical protein